MRLIKIHGPGWIGFTREYDPGEKYVSTHLWDSKDGRATKETVERMIPGCVFIGIKHDTGRCPINLTPKSWILVKVEQIYM